VSNVIVCLMSPDVGSVLLWLLPATQEHTINF